MFKITLEPAGLQWHYCPPGQCTESGCPGDCVHIDTDIHHLSAENHLRLIKATKMIADVMQTSGQHRFKEVDE